MGAKSTFTIDRETALEIIQERLGSLSNQAVANMLEEFPESDLRNYQISTLGKTPYKRFHITTKEQFLDEGYGIWDDYEEPVSKGYYKCAQCRKTLAQDSCSCGVGFIWYEPNKTE